MRTNVRVGRDVALSELLGQYDAVFLGTGPRSAVDPVVIDLANAGDPVTLTTATEGVFAEGSALRGAGKLLTRPFSVRRVQGRELHRPLPQA